MSITIRQVNPHGSQVYMGTLSGGVELHPALAQIANTLNIHTATVELLGGLTAVEFTEYDFVNQLHKPPLRFEQRMEIIAGHGTITMLDSKPHVHFHLALSFQNASAPNGVSVVGGHVAKATVYAVEFTLTSYPGPPVERGFDEQTGLKLWALPALEIRD